MIFDKTPEVLYKVSTISDGNMSLIKGDHKDALENRKKFLSSLKISINQIVGMRLEHGIKILKVGKENLGEGASSMKKAKTVDGLITNEPGVFLFLLTADCLPLAILDPTKKAIGAIHVSRMNLEKGMIKASVQSMTENFNSQPQDLFVRVGPSIGPCCYFMDLWQKAEDKLIENGVLAENIENTRECTYCSGKYFSYRKTQVEGKDDNARFTTVLGLKT